VTNIFAAYLFLGIAIILLVIGIWSKVMWVSYISAVSWIGCGMFFLIDGAMAGAIFAQLLGIFCLLSSAATFMMPIILRNRDKEPPTEIKVTHTDKIATEIERYRKAGNRFKTRRSVWE